MNKLIKQNISINNSSLQFQTNLNNVLNNSDEDNKVALKKRRLEEEVAETHNKKVKNNDFLKVNDETQPLEFLYTRNAVKATLTYDTNDLENLLNEKKAKGQAKRKATLQAKVLNTSTLISGSPVKSKIEYNYKHTKKSKVSKENVIPFGKETKNLLRDHIINTTPAFDTHLGLYITAQTPSSPTKGTRLPKKIFEVRKGYDIVLDKTFILQDTIRPARINSPYQDLALNADEIAIKMLERGAFDDLTLARKRIARDIQRVGGGKPIKGSYTAKEWDHLSEFGGVIKIDKARAPKATKYIDTILQDNEKTFLQRFGSDTPIYQGTGKGSVKIENKTVLRGAEALRTIAEAYDIEEHTDYGSDIESDDF